MKPDGKLDPGSSTPYEVLGRKITSEDFVGNQTFTPISNALLSIVNGFPSNGLNPLAGKPYFLLRSDFATSLAQAGIRVPAGVLPYDFLLTSYTNRTPDCSRITAILDAQQAAKTRADALGKAGFPGGARGRTTSSLQRGTATISCSSGGSGSILSRVRIRSPST